MPLNKAIKILYTNSQDCCFFQDFNNILSYVQSCYANQFLNINQEYGVWIHIE